MKIVPMECKDDANNVIRGAFLETDDLIDLLRIIDEQNANGLKGEDAALVLRLKDAVKALEEKDA